MANTYVKNNHYSDVSRGVVPNESFWYKFGECEIDNILTTLWSGATNIQPGLYQYPASAITMQIQSTSEGDVGNLVAIQGVDSDWKLQEEVIILNGINSVQTQYEYLRVWRMSVIDGGTLTGEVTLESVGGAVTYAHIEDGGLDVNQTQACLYSVPAGYELLVKKVTCTKSDVQPVKIFASVRDIGMYGDDTPFRVQLNWNIATVGFVDETPHPFLLTEKLDLEVRGIADNRSSDVAVNLYGHIERVNSVPIDVTGFSGVAIENGINLVWDEQKPSSTSDLKHFNITWAKSSRPDVILGKANIKDRSASGYTITGLEYGVEYTASIKWVGYDDLYSSTSTASATPGQVDFPVLAGLLDAVGTYAANAEYVTSDDEGVTWDRSAITGLTGYDFREIVSAGSTIYARVVSETLDKTATSTDALNWTVGESIGVLYGDEDIIYKENLSVIDSKIGSADWELTNIGAAILSVACDGTNYLVCTESDVKTSADGITYSTLGTPAMTSIYSISANSTVTVASEQRSSTVLGWKYYDGANWNISTTTIATIDEDEYGVQDVEEVDGTFVSIVLAGDYSSSSIWTSTDGDVWTEGTVPGTGLIVYRARTIDSVMYLSLADASFNGWMSTSVDGTTWTTPVQVDTGGFIAEAIG